MFEPIAYTPEDSMLSASCSCPVNPGAGIACPFPSPTRPPCTCPVNPGAGIACRFPSPN
ncbi:MAG: hypothetical protein GY950_16005 [bacterium]|nr:hypothetical protein [bacterium]